MESNRGLEKTGFQEDKPYSPQIDLQTDFVMVYGIGNDMEERVAQWKEKGYVIHLMAGVSWGEYSDYLNGKIDGRPHWDEAQKNNEYEYIIHGLEGETPLPYMVPTISYTEFLTKEIKRAVDAGVEAIHLEEPEFWVEGGYSDAFKREWEIYYKEPWKSPHESADGQYKASKLKAYLYTRCLDRLCSTLKEYTKVKYNRNLRFYVPTHSLINYCKWRIISPESRLLELPSIDGYIAQIWTGTSRTANIYEGVKKERTFEVAFLEYGIMQELVRGTGRKMWFLHDPIEDNPDCSWKDYKENYKKIVTASLLHPYISNYEVCPWPQRVFNGKYKEDTGMAKKKIPEEYATMLLTIMNTLRFMDQEEVSYITENTEAGLLLSDSAMFQRDYPEWYKCDENKGDENDSLVALNPSAVDVDEKTDWSSFFGLALPILKSGILVRPVQLDNIRRFTGYLNEYKILILSYEFMKPEYPDINNAIALWVKSGGILIYVGDGSDSFHKVNEWWNNGKKKYSNPAEHLFESMELKSDIDHGLYRVGRGTLGYLKVHPSKCAKEKEWAEKLRKTLKDAVDFLGNNIDIRENNSFILRRGPYIMGAAMEEAVTTKTWTIEGRFVDLFEAKLPVVDKYILKPDDQMFLYDLSYVKDKVELIAASSRIEGLTTTEREFTFLAKGPEGTIAYARFYSASKIDKVMGYIQNINNQDANDKSANGQDTNARCASAQGTGNQCSEAISIEAEWHQESSTILLRYANAPEGVNIEVHYM